MELRRYWFRFDDSAPIPGAFWSPLGYGVTAWSENDALTFLREDVFRGRAPTGISKIIADVDVSTLHSFYIRSNMKPTDRRGIWFPRGFAPLE